MMVHQSGKSTNSAEMITSGVTSHDFTHTHTSGISENNMWGTGANVQELGNSM